MIDLTNKTLEELIAFAGEEWPHLEFDVHRYPGQDRYWACLSRGGTVFASAGSKPTATEAARQCIIEYREEADG